MFNIHGVDREITVPAQVELSANRWTANVHFTVPYQIVPGTLTFTDSNDQTAFNQAGVTVAPTVFAINLDDEVPPTLPTVWGNSGCGLLGLECAVILGLAALRRRRS